MDFILVIDDEASIRYLLKEFLTKTGYYVDVAENGYEGIRLLNSGRNYCAVLTDIEMPEISGYNIADYIKKSDEMHFPVLAITGLYDHTFDGSLFDFVIQKPFDLKTLKMALRSLFHENMILSG